MPGEQINGQVHRTILITTKHPAILLPQLQSAFFFLCVALRFLTINTLNLHLHLVICRLLSKATYKLQGDGRAS